MSTCTECGAGFEPWPRKVTCSSACARARAKRIRPARTPGRRDEQGRLLVACSECGAEYPASRSSRTCSEACARERVRRQQREHGRRRYERDREALLARRREERAADPEPHRQRERERRAARPRPRATCRRCGAEFEAARRDARYCSEACASPVVERACEWCGATFTGPRRQRHCGLRCWWQRWRAEARAERRNVIGDELALAALAGGARSARRTRSPTGSASASGARHAPARGRPAGAAAPSSRPRAATRATAARPAPRRSSSAAAGLLRPAPVEAPETDGEPVG